MKFEQYLDAGTGEGEEDPIQMLAEAKQKLTVQRNRIRSLRQRLKTSEAQFHTIFNSSPVGILLMDLDGRLTRYNERFTQILAYEGTDLSGRLLADFLYSKDYGNYNRILRSLLRGESSSKQIVSRFVRRDGAMVWGALDLGAVPGKNGGPAEIIGMLADITDRKEMEAEIQEMNRRLLESLEHERLRIALDLHDGPMQELHSILYQIEGLSQMMETPIANNLVAVKEAILKIIQSLRETAQELRPPSLMDLGLEKAIRSHVAEFRKKFPDIKIKLYLSPDRGLLPENSRLSLFRIYQQAMMNVVRHSQASEVKVSFTLDAEVVTLCIEDDGCGFCVPERWVELVRQGHFGLAGMAERTEALGGTFEVRSAPGEGTSISVVIPQGPFDTDHHPLDGSD